MSKRKPPNAGKGRVKGVPNRITRDLRKTIKELVETNMPLAQESLDIVRALDPARYVELILKFAEFTVPKLNRTELAAEVKPVKPPSLGISFDDGGPGRTRTAEYSVEVDVAALEKLPPGADYLPDETGKNAAPMPAPSPFPQALPVRPAPEFIQGERPLTSKQEMWRKLGEPLKGPR